ncbi:MAG: MerR family DNA-binding transcriptional regulator [bacterium]|nr:MerR family DNA-binding transcriptional regulator [bacterium]
MEQDLDKKTVPIGQAAEFLGVSIDTVRRWDEKGILHSIRPDGKNRYFSVAELEKVKFSEPLTISEAAQKLDISEATLRRLEEKDLIKPERSSGGERMYTAECLENFLRSDYYLRQETIESKVLSPPETGTEDKNDSHKDVKNLHDQHRALNAQVEEQKRHIHRLNIFRKAFHYSMTMFFATFVLLVAIFTILFLLYPTATARWFGLNSQAVKAADLTDNSNLNQVETQGKVLGATYQPQVSSEPSFVSKVLQPVGGLSLEIVRRINPSTYSQIVAGQAIRDVNDILSVDADGNIVVNYNLAFPNSSYLKIPDNNLVQNLNADYLRGKVPGDTSGDLVYWDKNNSVAGLKIDSINLADNSVTNNTILDGAVTLGKMANLAANSFIGNNTANPVTPLVLSITDAKTLLSLNNVEDITLSTWPGTTNITTLGTVATGVWSGTAIVNAKIDATLTGKTYNSLTLTAQTTGFTIVGGTTPKTLTVALDASISGANTGDQTLSGLGGVATTRILTINGTAQDLSADRTWTISTVTGNAATATALQSARTIGGVSFDGTANITVASATGGFTVSGGNLALGANSLTMTGSLGVTGARLTKGWFTDLEVTNAIVGSVTGNAATVTTNANLTGDVTSVGNATTLTNAAVIAKVLTGYISGAGTVAATDSILEAIQKLNGNDATNANLTGPITSVGNATSIASQTGTGTTFVMDTAPTIAGGAISALTTLAVRDTSAAFDVTIAATSTTPLTLGRTLTLDVDNAGRTIKLGGNLTLTGDASISGTHTGTSSGTNTGDNATNSLYSGLAASKADVGQTFYIGTTQVAINRASAALTLAGITLTTPNIGVATGTSLSLGAYIGAGAWPASASFDYIGNRNLNQAAAGNYNILFDTNGALYLNAPTSQTIDFRINNGTALTVNADKSVTMTGAVTASNLSGTNTGDNAANSSTMYIGTTAVALNRASAALALTGITSIDGSSASTTGNAATVTTNANLTGPITSAGNVTTIASQTGTGTTFVMNTSPTLVTPALGAATYTTLGGGMVTATGLTLNFTQDIIFSQRANVTLAIQGQTSGSSTQVDIFAKDGDGTDYVGFNLFGVGTPASTTNYEALSVLWDTAAYSLSVLKGGTGAARALKFNIGAVNGLTVNTDSTVTIPTSLTTVGLTTTGNTILGNASTDTTTNTGRMIFRTAASDPQDATPASRPAGSVGEILYYAGKWYGCTDAATPTYEKFTSI